ncbi:CYC2-like cyclin, putative [Trypanosoma brucei brucei TREU927]|uniref:CYC2-like cyclin, putative n=1 Tax=Trypanosoma brucei brucei (strain 927/4 GUTat10.1) TaxID=185431 RepID=Q57XT7_TRYB2|nr:CYC2-like cyclin, putative [Trypanosoma brucei brucei TREU927]AAX69582.1 CYC2-like cyclin, putative [Trypanosoma brucei]AAZ12778.1 CYC2-like cyclin, putative [Trypanosoma brucei brucei TREU927]
MNPHACGVSNSWKPLSPQRDNIHTDMLDNINDNDGEDDACDYHRNHEMHKKVKRARTGTAHDVTTVAHINSNCSSCTSNGNDDKGRHVALIGSSDDNRNNTEVVCNKGVKNNNNSDTSAASGAVDERGAVNGLSPSCGQEEEARDELGQKCGHENNEVAGGRDTTKGSGFIAPDGDGRPADGHDSNGVVNGDDNADGEKRAVTLPIELDTVCRGLVLFLESLCEENSSEPLLTTDFHSSSIPGTSIAAYTQRFRLRGSFSGETLLVSLIMLLKYSFTISHPVTYYNVHRLMITSAMLSAKMREDRFFDNRYYSFLGGIKLSEMNKLELRFCSVLGWDLWIDDEDYETLARLMRRLVKELAEVEVSSNNDCVGEDVSAQNEVALREFGARFWAEHLRPWKCGLESNLARRAQRMEQSDRIFLNRIRERSRQFYLSESNGINGYGCSAVLVPTIYGRQMYQMTTPVMINRSGEACMDKKVDFRQQQQQQQQQFGIANRNSRELGTDHSVAAAAASSSVTAASACATMVGASGTVANGFSSFGNSVRMDGGSLVTTKGQYVVDGSSSSAPRPHNFDHTNGQSCVDPFKKDLKTSVTGSVGGAGVSCDTVGNGVNNGHRYASGTSVGNGTTGSAVKQQRRGNVSENHNNNNTNDIVVVNGSSGTDASNTGSNKWFSRTVRSKIQHASAIAVSDEQQQQPPAEKGLPWQRGERGVGAKRRKPDHYRDYR